MFFYAMSLYDTSAPMPYAAGLIVSATAEAAFSQTPTPIKPISFVAVHTQYWDTKDAFDPGGK